MNKKKHLSALFFILFSLVISIAYSCPNNCLFCLQSNACITCQDSFYLTTTGTCISKSVENCRIYNSINKCAVCQPTFKVENDKCIQDTTGCLLRNQNGVCQQCSFGTTLNIKGECLGVINCIYPQKQCKQCRKGYNLISNKCIYAGQDCQTISLNGLCIQCKSDYILNGFECVSKGSNAVINGNINMIQKCSLYSRNYNDCLQCQKGYQLFNNACRSSGQVYINTIQSANQKIRQHTEKTYIDTLSEFIKHDKATFSLSNQKDDVLDGSKKEVNRVIFQGVGTRPEQDDNCLIRSQNSLACSVCIDGYYYFNGLCKKKTPVCTKFNLTSNQCITCNDLFALLNGQCHDPHCLQAPYSQCQRCQDGYIINDQGYCYDPYCIIRKQGSCIKCAAGYVLDQNKFCYKIIQGCFSYSSLKKNCTKCQNNYSITEEGYCKINQYDRCLKYKQNSNQQCIQCRDLFALANGYCADLYCKTFSTSSSKNCQTCKDGYILSKNYYCYDQNCVLYNNGTCVNCANNYKLQNGFCVNILIGCLNVDPSNQKCNQCMDVYRLLQGNCVYSEKDRCLKYSNNLCFSCKPQYALVNGICVDLLCDKQQFTNNFYACIKCKPGFNITSQGLCYDQNCYKSVNGSCTWCADNYIIGPNGLCVKTSLGCLNWNQTERKCKACYNGYTLTKNGICTLDNATYNSNQSNNSPSVIIPQNPKITIPTVIDDTTNLKPGDIQVPAIIQNDVNCKSYDEKNNCVRCQGRYFIRYGKCQYVSDLCKTFNMKTGNCTSCQTGYAPYNQVQNGYDNCIKKITQQDPNCQLKNTNYFCIKCKPNYYINIGFCYLADTMCKTFNLYGGKCLSCYEGYTLFESKCIALTKQVKCKTYDFQNVCIECEDRYYVDKGVCKQVNSNCLAYQMQTGICYTCISGYSPSNGICTKVKEMVANCKSSNQLGICTQCNSRYYLESSTYTCKPVSSFCKNYDKNNGKCIDCVSGYKMRSDIGACVIENSDDLCKTFNDNGQCTYCQDGYFIIKSLKCVKSNSLCDLYNLETGDCQKCKDSHYLSFKQCIPKIKKQNLDQNCLLGDIYNFCLKCRDRYFINSGNCLKANDQCKTFNINTGACLTCYDGFIIKNTECISSNEISNNSDDHCELYSGKLCIKCKSQYYLTYDTSSPSCSKANPLCKAYNEFNGDCYSCIEGYTLNNGYCVINANVNSLNSNTNKNSNSNSQNINTQTKKYIQVSPLKCKQFDLQANICVTCYDRYFYSITDSGCKAVSNDCKTYDKTNGWCTSCFDGFYLNKTICQYNATKSIKQNVDYLSPKTYTNKIYCQKYDETGNKCLTCINGYQLLSSGACSVQGSNIINDPYCTAVTQRKCVNCLAGYYVQIHTGLCTLQSLLCAQFNVIGGECYRCKQGNILQDGVCFKPALGLDKFCSFYDGAYCVSCVSGYQLISFVCQQKKN